MSFASNLPTGVPVITRFNRVVNIPNGYIVLTMQNIRHIIQSRGWFSIPGLGYIFPFYDMDNTRSPQPSISLIQVFSVLMGGVAYR